jgi:hypothetical protein
MDLRNVGTLPQHYTESRLKRPRLEIIKLSDQPAGSSHEGNVHFDAPNDILLQVIFLAHWNGSIWSVDSLKINTYKRSVGKLEGKRSLERPRRKWKGNIKLDLKERGCESVDWIHLAQDMDQRRDLASTEIKLRML